jgi:hypothetical protein
MKKLRVQSIKDINMKLKVIFEDYGATVSKLKKHGISKLSAAEKSEIDADYQSWLKKKKKKKNTPVEFNDYVKKELKLED